AIRLPSDCRRGARVRRMLPMGLMVRNIFVISGGKKIQICKNAARSLLADLEAYSPQKAHGGLLGDAMQNGMRLAYLPKEFRHTHHTIVRGWRVRRMQEDEVSTWVAVAQVTELAPESTRVVHAAGREL